VEENHKDSLIHMSKAFYEVPEGSIQVSTSPASPCSCVWHTGESVCVCVCVCVCVAQWVPLLSSLALCVCVCVFVSV